MRNGAGIRALLLLDSLKEGGETLLSALSVWLGHSPDRWQSHPAIAISSGCGHGRLEMPQDGNGSWRVSCGGHWSSAGPAGLGHREQVMSMAREADDVHGMGGR